MLLESGDFKFARIGLARRLVGVRGVVCVEVWVGMVDSFGRGRDVREVVAWLCQQFSEGILAFQMYNRVIEASTYWILAVSAMVYVCGVW